MAHEEYLRRNLVHASSVGALANTRAALARARGLRSMPKWLIEALEGIEERAVKVPADMAMWRNAAPDAPDYLKEGKRHDEAPGQ